MWCDVKLLDLFLPCAAPVCGVGWRAALRRPAASALPRLAAPLCDRCGAPTAWPVARCRECAGRRLAFASARAAVAYDEAVRRSCRAWKERGLRRLAAEAGGGGRRRAGRPPAAEALAFVPPDRARSLERGHHPAERLARELGERWSLPVLRLLGRTRPASRQRGLSLADRRRNVAGAFAPAAESPARSCSSTTSTPAARPRTPQRVGAAQGRARAGSRW